MPKELETFFSAELTPLQQAALERIEYYKKELREKYGFYVRSAMELEFTTDDAKGYPIKHALAIDGDNPVLKYLENTLWGWHRCLKHLCWFNEIKAFKINAFSDQQVA